ncbi:MAG: flagellar biosynthesis protein FlhB [Pyrinomonadaceae bacterium]
MASERTEKATPKRREDARRKGQIARRPELAAVAGFLAALLTLRATGVSLAERAQTLFVNLAAQVNTAGELTPAAAHDLLIDAGANLALLTLPVICAAMAAGLAANFAQGGFTWNPSVLAPRADRFNPVANLKRVFGTQGPVELVKSFLKLGGIAGICYGLVTRIVGEAPAMVGLPAATTAATVGNLLYETSWRAGGALMLVAAADYAYGWYQHEKSLRMTKQEIRDEYKQQEGDPLVKSQRRRAGRALTQQRLAREVPTADVVVTNPTHFAVALRYDRERDSAPVVVAKGADYMAQRIRKLAFEHDVLVIENPPLARALYRSVEPGHVIPSDLFRAVAELLAYVYHRRRAT